MKITTALASLVAYTVMMAPFHVYGEKNEEKKFSLDDGIKMLGTLPMPSKQVKTETAKATNYVNRVTYSFEKNRQALNVLEAEYKSAYENAKTDDAKQAVNSNYLTKRLNIIQSTLGDLKDSQEKFKEIAEKVTLIIGNIDANKGLAEKAAQEMAKTKELETEIKTILREYNRIRDDEPTRGTKEHNEWEDKQEDLIYRYEIAIGAFDNAVYLNDTFEKFAQKLNVSGNQAQGWLKFFRHTSTRYRISIANLETAQTAHEIAIAINDANIDFVELKELATLATEAKGLIEDLRRIPQINELGSIPTAPTFVKPSMDMGIDLDKRREEIKASLNPFDSSNPSEK